MKWDGRQKQIQEQCPPPTPEAHMLARFSKQCQEKYYVKQDRMRGLTYELHTP